jgi:hypothetical protein
MSSRGCTQFGRLNVPFVKGLARACNLQNTGLLSLLRRNTELRTDLESLFDMLLRIANSTFRERSGAWCRDIDMPVHGVDVTVNMRLIITPLVCFHGHGNLEINAMFLGSAFCWTRGGARRQSGQGEKPQREERHSAHLEVPNRCICVYIFHVEVDWVNTRRVVNEEH